MESRKRLFEIIAKVGCDQREYLEALFKYIPEAVVKEIMYCEIQKNKIILHAGDSNDTVFFLLKGQVIGIDHQKLGRVYSFMDFIKMNIIGDFEAFGDFSKYCVTVRTTEDCKLLKISTKSYLNWIRHDENALFLRLNNILNTLTFERNFDREYIFKGCKERLMSYLVKLYKKEHSDTSDSFKVGKTQPELADKVGFHVRSVQRSIASLKKDGFITITNGKVIISYDQYLKLEEFIEGIERG
ncbi:MAG: Crp/Fnr family transcriptional regulator [Clostridium butyricum]|nr:Crp/Fnr family transcriptional regulator [Clostridium butyricum]